MSPYSFLPVRLFLRTPLGIISPLHTRAAERGILASRHVGHDPCPQVVVSVALVCSSNKVPSPRGGFLFGGNVWENRLCRRHAMADRYCTNCGQGLGFDDKFCPKCGRPPRPLTRPTDETPAAKVAEEQQQTRQSSVREKPATPERVTFETATAARRETWQAGSETRLQEPASHETVTRGRTVRCPNCENRNSSREENCGNCNAPLKVSAPSKDTRSSQLAAQHEAPRGINIGGRGAMVIFVILIAATPLVGIIFALYFLFSSDSKRAGVGILAFVVLLNIIYGFVGFGPG